MSDADYKEFEKIYVSVGSGGVTGSNYIMCPCFPLAAQHRMWPTR